MKSQLDAEAGELARFAKALAHPARIAILRFLAQQANCYCGRIVDVLPLAQSTVSQHLAELKDAGLVQGTVDGVKVCYCLDRERLDGLGKLLGEFFEALRGTADGDTSAPACCAPPRRARVKAAPRPGSRKSP